MQYYLNINNQSIGPMSADQVMAYNIDPNTPVSADGGPWQPLYTHPELMQLLQVRKAPAAGQSDSKRVLCGIMAIIFGTLGIQYFLCGKTTAGILTILISLVTCGAWGLITFIQGILMLTMSDEQFEQKFVTSTTTFPIF